MKKLLATAACAAMALGVCAMPVNAASGVNDAEQQILDYMAKGATVDGETIAYPKGSDEYNTLEEYLALDGIDLSQKDVDTIKASAKDTQAFLEKHWNDTITPELLNEMLGYMGPAVNTLGMKISYDAKADKLIITDMNGNVLVEEGNIIYPEETDTTKPDSPTGHKGGSGNKVNQKVPTAGKGLEKTGEDFSSTYMVFGSLAMILAGAGIFASRKKTAEE